MMRVEAILIFIIFNLIYLSECSSKSNNKNNYLYYSYKSNNKIVINNTNSQLNPVDVPNWTTQAFYNASQNSTGWDLLEIWSNPAIPDVEQVYHAGYMEGYITRQQIWNYYWNNIDEIKNNKTLFAGKTCYKVVTDYFDNNLKYITKMTVDEKNLNNPFWYQVMLLYKQLHGILDGYNSATNDKNITNQNLDIYQLMYINFKEEAEDVFHTYRLLHLNATNNNTKSPKHAPGFDVGTHCSALIKIVPGNSEVFISHDTWSGYETMNRIIKRFKLPLKTSNNIGDLIPGMSVAFSSYPGVLASIDDFYVINSGLVVMETTNEIFNDNLYKKNLHLDGNDQVGEEIRNIVANRLARNGSSWMQYFRMENSGTYNNQWMIIDLNHFKPGFDPTEGFLSVLEQAPGIIETGDQTNHMLQYGYWSSYNIPFYPKMYEVSGNKKAAENNTWDSYTECPRAKIFKKEQSRVIDLDSMIWMMRYNYYQTDPYSRCQVCKPTQNACNAIASRCDLNLPNGNYTLMPAVRPNFFGATDTKIVSYSLFTKGEMLAIGGPTTSGVDPFSWTKTLLNASKVRHIGQPEEWNFKPIITNWLLPHTVRPPTDDGKGNNEEPPIKKHKNSASSSQQVSLIISFIIALLISKYL